MLNENPLVSLSQSLAHAVYEGLPEFEYQERDWSKGFQEGVEPEYITKKRKHDEYDVALYSMYTQTWSSTSLGFGGVGGQAITDSYTVVIESLRILGFCVYFGGRFAYRIDKPNSQFWTDIQMQSLSGVDDAKKRYESL